MIRILEYLLWIALIIGWIIRAAFHIGTNLVMWNCFAIQGYYVVASIPLFNGRLVLKSASRAFISIAVGLSYAFFSFSVMLKTFSMPGAYIMLILSSLIFLIIGIVAYKKFKKDNDTFYRGLYRKTFLFLFFSVLLTSLMFVPFDISALIFPTINNFR